MVVYTTAKSPLVSYTISRLVVRKVSQATSDRWNSSIINNTFNIPCNLAAVCKVPKTCIKSIKINQHFQPVITCNDFAPILYWDWPLHLQYLNSPTGNWDGECQPWTHWNLDFHNYPWYMILEKFRSVLWYYVHTFANKKHSHCMIFQFPDVYKKFSLKSKSTITAQPYHLTWLLLICIYSERNPWIQETYMLFSWV